ncbi:lysophospholipid acyltransferase family protein [Desulfosudis oleivorans]|uniref:1-acyl-sn-glycerol-3-phosphate acyltransferase n=1 Tax=Desulfosudis oleivorans (strain DSM 6200 / JCM 39069 / Hxd3) TaxID=96561 RepID=A8ZWI5_DESOH|nr:lysophospholipid acyltransferase family protein [Desulfosudis oleivorans]ABW66793.1 1-acyl-sn-glycerol-3-phosphate acyltransferase [Desulfosudis oleivorans Hxd3]
MKTIALCFYAIYRPAFYLLVIIDTTLLGLLTIAASYFDPKGNRVHYIGKFWSRLNMLLSGVRVKMIHPEHIDPKRSYIVMSKHQSHYDVWALIGFLPLQLRWVMKMELREIPVFGLGCERMGHIYIDRSHPDRAYKSLEVAGEKIRSGASVVFFPEGTRSTDGNLRPFKKGGFNIALAAGVPILPITVRGSRQVLPKGSGKIMPGTIELVIHEPVLLDGYTTENREELIQRVHQIIEADLKL